MDFSKTYCSYTVDSGRMSLNFLCQRNENGLSKKFEVSDLNGKMNFRAEVGGKKLSTVLLGEEAKRVRDLLNFGNKISPIIPSKPIKPIKPLQPLYTAFDSSESIQTKMEAYQEEMKSMQESYQRDMTKYQTRLVDYSTKLISRELNQPKSSAKIEQLIRLLGIMFIKHSV